MGTEISKNPAVENFIRKVGRLPSLPSLYLELTSELRSPGASFQRIGRIISKDLAMTSKILQVVNSAYFGISRRISSVDRAVGLLGLEMVKNLVLGVEIFSMFEPHKMAGLTIAGLWRHSMTTAGFARKIATEEKLPGEEVEQAITSAFIHDIGKLILATESPEEYKKADLLARNKEIPLFEAESMVFGFSHAEAGGFLLTLWGLPEPIVEAVTHHHTPMRAESRRFNALAVVHVANVFEHQMNDFAEGAFIQPIDMEYLSLLSKAEKVDQWKVQLEELGPE